jgi:tetratricopeptide (TPR) repeat protein
MVFLTQGEKIKMLRKKLKMNQQDLVSERITRPFISMLESGKRRLTYITADAIIKKFNKRAEELGISFEEDVNFLLRSKSEDAYIYCLKKLKNNNINVIIDEILHICDEFNLMEIKSAALKTMGDWYFDKKKYTDAFIKYTNAVDICKDIKQNNDAPYLYWRCALCKANLLQYKEALFYFQLSHHYGSIYDDSYIKDISLYHIAKCYKKLSKINLAKAYINNYLTVCNKNENFKYYIYAIILKANCYEIEEKFDTVIDIYMNLINEISDSRSPFLGLIYNNLGLAYYYKADFKKSMTYFEMAEWLRKTMDKANLSHTLIEKSIVLSKQGLYDKAVETIEAGIIEAKKYNDVEYLVKGNYMLADIYSALNDTGRLEEAYLRIADLLKNTHSIDLILIYNKLSIMYLVQNKINKSNMYLMLSNDLINKNGKLLYNVNI